MYDVLYKLVKRELINLLSPEAYSFSGADEPYTPCMLLLNTGKHQTLITDCKILPDGVYIGLKDTKKVSRFQIPEVFIDTEFHKEVISSYGMLLENNQTNLILHKELEYINWISFKESRAFKKQIMSMAIDLNLLVISQDVHRLNSKPKS